MAKRIEFENQLDKVQRMQKDLATDAEHAKWTADHLNTGIRSATGLLENFGLSDTVKPIKDYAHSLRTGADVDKQLAELSSEHSLTLGLNAPRLENAQNAFNSINRSLASPSLANIVSWLAQSGAAVSFITSHDSSPWQIRARFNINSDQSYSEYQKVSKILSVLDSGKNNYTISNVKNEHGNPTHVDDIIIKDELIAKMQPLFAPDPAMRENAQKAFLNSEVEKVERDSEGARKFSSAVEASGEDWKTHLEGIKNRSRGSDPSVA